MTEEALETPVEKAEKPAISRDRGPVVAKVVVGGLVLLGLGLIARGPRDASGAPAAAVTHAAVVDVADAGAVVLFADAGVSAPPKPFVPVWRVASMKSDPKIEVIEGTYGKKPLSSLPLSKTEQKRLSHAFEDARRLERAPAGASFVMAKDRASGNVVAFEHVVSPFEIWQAKTEDASLVVKKLDLAIEKKKVAAAVAVTSDLEKALLAAGYKDDAVAAIDDALDGHVDLGTVKAGTRVRFIGSEDWVEGAFARFHVDAMEVLPKDGQSQRFYFYERTESKHPHAGFYDAKGQQPFKGQFRSPLPATRITSRFNPKRLHPVLHTVMPHNGVDFGAASGTPVYASAPGTVASVGDGGRCGNMIQIDHANNLTTGYCHLSKFAAGIHAGMHVEARQLIGYVGQTGSATGPHLHFAVKRGGVFIDPMGIKMDGVKVLPPAERDGFATQRKEWDAALDAIVLPAEPAGATAPPAEDKDEEPGGEE